MQQKVYGIINACKQDQNMSWVMYAKKFRQEIII